MMTGTDSFKEHWPALIPKVRDRWPELTEDDIAAVHGDLDALVERVRARYGGSRADVMNELTTLTQPARIEGVDVEAGHPKTGERG